jgi:transportin-3
VADVWPVLSSTFDRFPTDREIIGGCCHCMGSAILLIGQQSAPLLRPLVIRMVAFYAAYKHSCFYYLAIILVEVFEESEFVPELISMLEAFLPTAFQLLQGNGLCQHPDTLDGLFRLSTRFLQRMPNAFLRIPTLTNIFECSVRASTLEYRDANSSVMQFLSEFIRSVRIHEENVPAELWNLVLGSIIRPRQAQLFTTLMHSYIFSLSTCLLPRVAEVLFEFMLIDREVSFVKLQI